MSILFGFGKKKKMSSNASTLHIQAMTESTLQNNSWTNLKTLKKKTRTQLKKQLDKVFSQFIRWRDADDSGYVNCFTCGAKKKAFGVGCIQAGHFQSRRHMSLRWDSEFGNVQPQCSYCNVLCSGQQFVMARRIDEIYGNGRALELEQMAKQTKKFTISDLEELIHIYKIKVKDLTSES